MKQQIQDFLKKEYPDIDFNVSYPPEGFGDYSTNIAFLLAKKSSSPTPQKIAEFLIEKLRKKFKKEFEKIEVANNGFINFYLSRTFLQKQIEFLSKNKNKIGKANIGKGSKVIIEYSQPNIAKEMHVGHLRSTIIGDALANIHEFLGYKIVRWNYLGDWGTQFGNLIAAYKLWGNEEEVRKNPIPALNNLYIRIHKEMKSSAGRRTELEKTGKREFRKLEEGDKENRELWKWFKDESLKEFEKIYKVLGVKFDLTLGESFFENDLKPLVKELLDKGIAEESEGAIIIPLDKFSLPPALIQKSDGASLYLTRDIAGLRYRFKKFKPRKILYIVGNEQSLHFQQLFSVAKLMDLDSAELKHIKFGLVLGEDKRKLSTREGRVIQMKELIDKTISLAGKVVEEKNPELSEKEKEEIAETVAIGALKYNDLKEHRHSDIVFDWNKMLDFSGDSGPYLQYTYARLKSILRKAPKIGKADFKQLTEENEMAALRHLIKFPEAIISSAESYLTNNIALYLYQLAKLANRFYEKVPVIKDENPERRNARLILIGTVAATLKTGLNLLGLKVLEKI